MGNLENNHEKVENESGRIKSHEACTESTQGSIHSQIKRWRNLALACLLTTGSVVGGNALASESEHDPESLPAMTSVNQSSTSQYATDQFLRIVHGDVSSLPMFYKIHIQIIKYLMQTGTPREAAEEESVNMIAAIAHGITPEYLIVEFHNASVQIPGNLISKVTNPKIRERFELLSNSLISLENIAESQKNIAESQENIQRMQVAAEKIEDFFPEKLTNNPGNQ